MYMNTHIYIEMHTIVVGVQEAIGLMLPRRRPCTDALSVCHGTDSQQGLSGRHRHRGGACCDVSVLHPSSTITLRPVVMILAAMTSTTPREGAMLSIQYLI